MKSRRCWLGMGTLVLVLFSCVAQAGPLEDGLAAYKADNYKRALALWRPLAEKGNATAQYNVGALYTNGRGVPKDDRKAFHWYHRAAQQRFLPALLQVGIAYYRGTGIQKNNGEALRWLRKAGHSAEEDKKPKIKKDAEVWVSRVYSDMRLFPDPLPSWRAGQVKAKMSVLQSVLSLPRIELSRTYVAKSGPRKLTIEIHDSTSGAVLGLGVISLLHADPGTLDENGRQALKDIKKAGSRRYRYGAYKGARLPDSKNREMDVIIAPKLPGTVVIVFGLSQSKGGAADFDIVNAYIKQTNFELIRKTLDRYTGI